MGYRHKQQTFLLVFEGEYEGLEMEMRVLDVAGFLTMSKVTSSEERTESDLATMFRLFAKGLKSWNMEDEQGEPLPADYDTVMTLDAKLVAEAVAAWMEGMAGTGKDLGKGSNSTATSPVQLPTMEAL